jgi:hypothetical protein
MDTVQNKDFKSLYCGTVKELNPVAANERYFCLYSLK